MHAHVHYLHTVLVTTLTCKDVLHCFSIVKSASVLFLYTKEHTVVYVKFFT